MKHIDQTSLISAVVILFQNEKKKKKELVERPKQMGIGENIKETVLLAPPEVCPNPTSIKLHSY